MQRITRVLRIAPRRRRLGSQRAGPV